MNNNDNAVYHSPDHFSFGDWRYKYLYKIPTEPDNEDHWEEAIYKGKAFDQTLKSKKRKDDESIIMKRDGKSYWYYGPTMDMFEYLLMLKNENDALRERIVKLESPNQDMFINTHKLMYKRRKRKNLLSEE